MHTRAITMTVVLATCLAGCVEREMTITSEPDGALVYVSDKEMGRTPVTFSFLWYGDYEIVLRREGHKTLVTGANVSPPVYGLPPLDLFSEIAPWTYHDRRYLHYKLKKLTTPGDPREAARLDDELIQRAEKMRQENFRSVEK